MGTTGETVPNTGVYRCVCSRNHTNRILLAQNELYPPCTERTEAGMCGAAVAWQREPAPPKSVPPKKR